MLNKIKVLIVDDSALVRDILEKNLSSDPMIEVVGKAPDVYVARDKIVLLHPDVMTLDIEMPRMDGIEFLRRLMPQYPIPVVMVSAMTAPSAEATLAALEAGAVDFVLKPSAKVGKGLELMIKELIEKIKTASHADLSHWKKSAKKDTVARQAKHHILAHMTYKLIAIGASTGGTVALQDIIVNLPADTPGTIIVQHMPPVFTKLFAERLNDKTKVRVKEAESGDRVVTGQILIAPGGFQMRLKRSGGNYIVQCDAGEPVNGHCPSVDVLFHSVATEVGPNALGIILTGMGRDGANGMLAMRQAGARTMAQDKESSVVFGMPKEAFANGGAERLVPLADIPDTIFSMLQEMK